MRNSSIQPIRSGKQQACSISHTTSTTGGQGTCVTNLYTSVQLSSDLCNSSLCELHANTKSHDFLSFLSVITTKIIQLYTSENTNLGSVNG
jgi:hypothetical protein